MHGQNNRINHDPSVTSPVSLDQRPNMIDRALVAKTRLRPALMEGALAWHAPNPALSEALVRVLEPSGRTGLHA